MSWVVLQKKCLIIKQSKETEHVQHENKLGCRESWLAYFLCLHRTKGPDVTPEAEETTGVRQPESPLPVWAGDHPKDYQQNKKHC